MERYKEVEGRKLRKQRIFRHDKFNTRYATPMFVGNKSKGELRLCLDSIIVRQYDHQ